MKDSFNEQYNKKILPALKEKFGYKNNLAVPKVTKVVLNVGTGHGLKDPKFNEAVEDTLLRITGQKPVKTISRKSISNFKIREGLVVGMSVTLRGARMHDFLNKLINVTLPRVRDFRGLTNQLLVASGNGDDILFNRRFNAFRNGKINWMRITELEI